MPKQGAGQKVFADVGTCGCGRLLDDNRELFVPELQETVRAHPHFMLFATQNPAGAYGGRKVQALLLTIIKEMQFLIAVLTGRMLRASCLSHRNGTLYITDYKTVLRHSGNSDKRTVIADLRIMRGAEYLSGHPSCCV